MRTAPRPGHVSLEQLLQHGQVKPDRCAYWFLRDTGSAGVSATAGLRIKFSGNLLGPSTNGPS
jgi:hypothetical protein